MRVIIAGSREFNNFKLLCKVSDFYLQNQSNIQIVSGTAKGADSLGERYAKKRRFSIKRFPAQWQTYGKSAGYFRNKAMVMHSQGLIAFWNGRSRGTGSIIRLAKNNGLKVRVKYF